VVKIANTYIQKCAGTTAKNEKRRNSSLCKGLRRCREYQLFSNSWDRSEIVLHAMESDSKKRYSTAVAIKEDLDNSGEVQLTGRCHRLQRRPLCHFDRHFLPVKLILRIMRQGP